MKIAHLSLTPLAGAPIRIVRAINNYSDIRARLINLNPFAYGTRTYDEDINFNLQKQEALDFLAEADLVHLHHWMNLKDNPFGIDLSNKKVIRHFHSEPRFIEKVWGVNPSAIDEDLCPKLVVAQFQERFYPTARPVPNIIDLAKIEKIYRTDTSPLTDDYQTVMFAPTSRESHLVDRWNTKGFEETIRLMKAIEAKSNLRLVVYENVPNDEILVHRKRADFVIDEIVTGSYHLSSLESLALGKPTFAFLDSRVASLLSSLTSSYSLPWLNVNRQTFEEILLDLANNRELARQVGEYSRYWIKKYWAEKNLTQHYVTAYQDVLSGVRVLRPYQDPEYLSVRLQDVTWSKL